MFLAKKFFHKIVQSGELIITTPSGTYPFGSPRAGKPPVRVTMASDAVGLKIALNPALAAGEAFMDGRLTVEGDDIMGLLDLIGHNVRWDRENPTRVALWRTQQWLAPITQMNGILASRRNVAHHYDLDDRLYDLFLDPARQYSCAFFDEAPDEAAIDLTRAQLAKMAHIAAKLQLSADTHVLDIGCGWGGLALYLNRVSGAKVTGITLSKEQLAVAEARAKATGQDADVTFRLIDYRELSGQFDRIVSVGMFEHVGKPNYQRYFDCIRTLLAPDGVALVHTIARADGPGTTDPWTAKYIFPGGYAPALSEMVPHIERAWLWTTDIEVLRLHYGYTLVGWYKACAANRAAIEATYDARFYRMWMFYLAAAASAFFHDGHMNVQIQMTRARDTLPLTREYMAAAEARYRAMDGLGD